MISTTFTERVGCTAPVQLAAIGGVCTPELVVAVSEAGGLGMYPGVMLDADSLQLVLQDLRSKTTGKIGVNFLMPFLDEACVDTAAQHADVVEFFYDTPRPDLVQRAGQEGALVSWQVGSAEEARAALDSGCHLLVAQGVEAGGHVRGTTSTLQLLVEILAFAEVPVIAAGGVSTGRGLAAALAAGASAVRIGTRFVASNESGAHPDYIDRLLRARAEDTVLTTAFGSDWPNAPHRVLTESVEAAQAVAEDVVGTRSHDGTPINVLKFSSSPPSVDTTGRVEAMALYAGQSVGVITRRQPAGEIVLEIVTDAEKLLNER